MSKIDKLIKRILSYPINFTREELVNILNHFGYKELKKGKTGGSRRKFADLDKNIINIHKPRPQNIVKEYVIKIVVEHLKEKGKLKDE